MFDLFVGEYLKKINPSDVINFAKLHNIILSNQEAEFIIPYIRNNWRTFIYGNPSTLLDEIKRYTTVEAFDKYVRLFIIIKNYFKKE